MKILIDECLSPKWIELLRSLGHEPTHWLDVGHQGDPDEQLMNWAKDHGAIIFTKDMDFSRLLYFSQESLPSVIQLRGMNVLANYTRRAVAEALVRYLHQLETGHLVTISLKGTRVRVLPLG